MKRLLLSFIFVGCFIGNLLAQEALDDMHSITVTGTVIDATNDEPFIGATVEVKDTQEGVCTDYKGHFSITAYQGSTLAISSLGYDTVEVIVHGSPINVRLLPSKFHGAWVHCAGNPNPMDEVLKITVSVFGPDGYPLAGDIIYASLSNVRDTISTDNRGNFTLEAKRWDTLRVESLGYYPVEGVVNGNVFTIRLDEVNIPGLVVDAVDGQPLIAASVWHKQTNGRYSAVAATDYDGRFELSFLPEDTLMVERIGYKTQKLLPSGDSILVRMEMDSTIVGCPEIIMYPVSGVVLDK